MSLLEAATFQLAQQALYRTRASHKVPFNVSNELSIAQWNCRGIYRKLYELKGILSSLQNIPDVILLQETHLIEKYSPKLRGYYLYRRDKTLHSGGLAIFVRENLSSSLLNLSHVPLEVMGICIGGLNIINMYLPPDIRLVVNDLAFLESYTSRTLIFGDFNAHHQSWGSRTANQRGTALSHFLNLHDFIVTNQNTPTRVNVAVNAVNRFSLLDLTIASPDIAIKCQTEVTEHLLGSDHYIVLTHYAQAVSRRDFRPPTWSFGKANWLEFVRLVDEKLVDLSHADIEMMYDHFSTSLIESALATIPRTKHCRKVPVPWWTDDCKKAVCRKKAAFMKMKRTFHFADIINYRKMRAECRKIILNAKREHWDRFCAELNVGTNINKVWKVYRSISNASNSHAIVAIKDENNTFVTDDQEKANILGQQFSKVSSSLNYASAFLAQKSDIDNELSSSLAVSIAKKNCMDDWTYLSRWSS